MNGLLSVKLQKKHGIVYLKKKVCLMAKNNKVWIVFQHDGFYYSGVVGVFDSKEVATRVVTMLTQSDDGLLYNHYVKEFEVKKSIDSSFLVE